MNKIQFRTSLIDPNNKFMAFQPKNYSRQYNKSKSNKKKHMNKNLLSPCQPLGDKLLKAAIQKNQIKITNNRRQKTQQSLMRTSMSMDGGRCFNHPDKKGQYFLQSQPNKKFCLKCNLTLNAGNHSSFMTKQKYHKKQVLDKFQEQLIQLKKQIQNSRQTLHSSIQSSQLNFSQHSNYINQSFTKVKQQIEEKRRELLNGLIIAQQNLKKQYEENLKKIKKMNKSIDKYDFDIKKFYDQIIEELPKDQFDSIMEEYQDKLNTNIKNKLKKVLTKDGICVYIPTLELGKIIQKANVEYYQPISEPSEADQRNSPLFQKTQYPNKAMKRSGSNSLDSKMGELIAHLNPKRKENDQFKLAQKKRQIDLTLFDRRTANFLSQENISRGDKENINLQNLTQDYLKAEQVGKLTFKI